MKQIDHSNDGRRTQPLPSRYYHETHPHILYGKVRENTGVGDCCGDGYYRRKLFKVKIGDHTYQAYEGESCDLFFSSAHVYRWHPVTAIMEFLRLPCFSHITKEQAAAVLAAPYRDPRYYIIEPPRLSEHCAFREWCEAYGLYCRSCDTTFTPGYDDTESKIWWWQRHDFCSKCALTIERKRVDRETQERLREREFAKALRIRREQQEARRMAADAEYRKRKEEKRREREREKLEMRAAYELVKEIGLIDAIRERGADHETGKAA